MTTDDLIRALVADGHVGRKPVVALLVALPAATSLAALLFFTRIGFRDDIDAALYTVRFLFKFAVILPLAVVAVGSLFRNTGPTPSPGRWAPLLPLPLVLLGAGVVAELLATPQSEWLARLIGSNAVNCMTLIPLLAAGPLAMFIAALRNGAAVHPGLSGAMAGLAAGSIAAAFYAMNCFDDSPLFVITWYPIAILGAVLAGYFAGVRVLQW
jgi:hypothetical protein